MKLRPCRRRPPRHRPAALGRRGPAAPAVATSSVAPLRAASVDDSTSSLRARVVGDVQRIELLALARGLLARQQLDGAGRRRASRWPGRRSGAAPAPRRANRPARPWSRARGAAPSLSSSSTSVGFEALGAVHGEQPHRLGRRQRRRLDAPGAQRAHQRIGRGEAAAVELAAQRPAAPRRLASTLARSAAGAAAAKRASTSPSWKIAASASCGGSAASAACQRRNCAPMPASGAGRSSACSRSNQAAGRGAPARCAQRQLHQRLVVAAPNSGELSARASDRSCPGETSASSSATTSCTSGASPRSVFSGCCAAMCRRRSSSCISASRSRRRASTMISRRRSAGGDARGDPARPPAGIPVCSRRSSGSTRGTRQAVAPGRRRAVAAAAGSVAPSRRRAAIGGSGQHGAGSRATRWCARGSRRTRPPSCACAHHRVDQRRSPPAHCAGCGRSSAGRRPAPSRTKACAATKHLRLGAPEAVDALLGIAHDEHAGRRAAGAGIAAAASACSACHCSGLVSWNSSISRCAHARVEPLLHPARQHRRRRAAAARRALDVVHVDPAALALELRRMRRSAGA